MIEKIQKLTELGAGEFEHVDGTLIEHLKGTQELLREWSAKTELQDAGLYHAAYGTAGFGESIVSTEHRSNISDIIGSAAEELVYQYCACDRQKFFAKIGNELDPEFNNRFTNESYHLSPQMLKDICELTAANEIEVSIENPAFIAEHGAELANLFTRMTQYLSLDAQARSEQAFGDSHPK